MAIAIRRRSGLSETESLSSSSSSILHNITGRAPAYNLPHHGGNSFRSSGSGSPYQDAATTRGGVSFNVCLGLGIILFMFPWVPAYLGTYYKSVDLRDEYESLQLAHKSLITELKSSVDTRRSLTDQTKSAEEMNKNLLLALKDYGDNIDPDNNLYGMAEDVEEAYVARIDDLESVISLWSEQKLRSEYGDDAERLRFTVTLTESVNDRDSFILETSRIKKMPHSVDFFQQMVQEQMCDGLVMFVRNDPSADFIRAQMVVPKAANLSKTRSSNLLSSALLFTERSPENPLTKYSVSFGGGRRAGPNQGGGQQNGPGFVVHMQDDDNTGNRRVPQGDAYDIESAFAKVVEGHELLDSIMEMSRDANNRLVTIKTIRLTT